MHRIEKNLLGKQSVHYECPHCRGELISPLEDAGNREACPTCGGKLVVPGAEDLARHRREQDASRQQREQERRTAAMLEARAREEAEQLAAYRAREKARQQFLSGNVSLSVADRLLAWAFTFGKVVSIIAVAAGFLVMIGAGVWLFTLREAPPRTQVLPVAVPTSAEYAKVASARSAGGAGSAAGGGSEARRQRLTKLLSSTNASRFLTEMVERSYDNAVDHELGDAFVDGLAAFIKGTPATDDSLIWYMSTFDARIAAHNRAVRDRLEEQRAARATLAAQRTLALMTMGMALAALLTFLVLPLLILIEENTRRLRATTALAAAERDLPTA